ncbi:MAG: hypothetical protein U5J83_10710, partial [Bryobacterales bacterium]|nr:hypothetical protein [Bryobacterales bacterium]
MFNRREILGCLAGAGAYATAPVARNTNPNVLMLIVDDLNTWAGPWHASSRDLTPELNRLAARSVVFANAYCASPAMVDHRAQQYFTGRALEL